MTDQDVSTVYLITEPHMAAKITQDHLETSSVVTQPLLYYIITIKNCHKNSKKQKLFKFLIKLLLLIIIIIKIIIKSLLKFKIGPFKFKPFAKKF